MSPVSNLKQWWKSCGGVRSDNNMETHKKFLFFGNYSPCKASVVGISAKFSLLDIPISFVLKLTLFELFMITSAERR